MSLVFCAFLLVTAAVTDSKSRMKQKNKKTKNQLIELVGKLL